LHKGSSFYTSGEIDGVPNMTQIKGKNGTGASFKRIAEPLLDHVEAGLDV